MKLNILGPIITDADRVIRKPCAKLIWAFIIEIPGIEIKVPLPIFIRL